MDVKYKEREFVPVLFIIIRDVGLNPGTPQQKKIQKNGVGFRMRTAQSDSGKKGISGFDDKGDSRQSLRQAEGGI